MAADTKHIFSESGPSYLSSTVVNWGDEHHKRSVLASLVNGAYVREHDRRKNRHGDQALAPPWWQSFHFTLVDDLIDKHDDSYFGAVYEAEHDHHRSSDSIGSPRPPRYVIAFRGTVKKSGTWVQDFKLNLLSVMNLLQKTSRFKRGFESARELVRQNGNDVWLAGHSLGSALALLVGRKMVTDVGAHLETYLFNPPYDSLSSGLLASHMPKLGHAIKEGKSFLIASLAAAVKRDGDDDPFIIALSTWIPKLFINPSDPICFPFIDYFEHRDYMESKGHEEIERVATVTSIRTMVLSAAGVKDCEALRLIPSAFLTVNAAPSNGFKEAHGINQWWRRPSPDVQFNCKLHRYE